MTTPNPIRSLPYATLLAFTPTSRVASFATQHPAQVHTTPSPTTFFWFLNAQKPPFDDVRARRAVWVSMRAVSSFALTPAAGRAMMKESSLRSPRGTPAAARG